MLDFTRDGASGDPNAMYWAETCTHVYIVLYSATMLMIGPSTFLEDEDEHEKVNIMYPTLRVDRN